MVREPRVMLSCRRGPSMKVDDSFMRFSGRNRFSRISLKWTGSTVGKRIWREEIAGGKGGGAGLVTGTGCWFPPRLVIRFKRTSKTCSAGGMRPGWRPGSFRWQLYPWPRWITVWPGLRPPPWPASVAVEVEDEGPPWEGKGVDGMTSSSPNVVCVSGRAERERLPSIRELGLAREAVRGWAGFGG